jgi:two-component system heavy metal sensor histidine kinase CusS
MVENLLFLARTERADMEIEKHPFLVHEAFVLAADIFEVLLEEKGVSLLIEANEKLTIFGDKGLFQRILVNLISNAIRYTPTGGRITLGAHQQQGHQQQKSVLVYVQDTGAGMSPEVVAHAFERLYRADRARTSHGESNLGLGLALVKNMMALHQGTARIQSTEGQGTTIFLEFPVY